MQSCNAETALSFSCICLNIGWLVWFHFSAEFQLCHSISFIREENAVGDLQKKNVVGGCWNFHFASYDGLPFSISLECIGFCWFLFMSIATMLSTFGHFLISFCVNCYDVTYIWSFSCFVDFVISHWEGLFFIKDTWLSIIHCTYVLILLKEKSPSHFVYIGGLVWMTLLAPPNR